MVLIELVGSCCIRGADMAKRPQEDDSDSEYVVSNPKFKRGLLASSLSLSLCFLFLKVASRLVLSLVFVSLEAIVSTHKR